MAPSLSLFVLSIYRCFQLSRRLAVVNRRIDALVLGKIMTLVALTAIQVALVVLYSLPGRNLTRTSLAAACSSLVATLALAAVSYYEHYRSLRPSFLLSAYLGLTILFDVCQVRTLWLRSHYKDQAAVFTAGIALKFVLLLLESVEKRTLLREPFRHYSPEALGGMFNRSVFWWLNSLLLQGSKSHITQDTLMPLDRKLAADEVRNLMRLAWSRCDRNRKHCLALATMIAFHKSILLMVFPRLCLVGFKISQPLLIHRAVALLSQPKSGEKDIVGRALIGATFLIYLGSAFSTAWYKHQIYRCITKIRGGLISLVYDRTLELRQNALTDTAAVTLTSADIEQIAAGMENSDVLWATPIELALAIFILSKQIGLACIVPIVIALGCATAAVLLSKKSKSSQRKWVDAIQDRITTTSAMLNNIKGIRMTGLSSTASASVHQLRVTELNKSKSYQKNLAVRVAISVFPQAVSPMAAIVLYVLFIKGTYGNSLSPATVFSSLSLISMLGEPMMQFMSAFPLFVASIACYDRIEKYILNSEQASDALSSNDGSDGVPSPQLLASPKTPNMEMMEIRDVAQKQSQMSSENLVELQKSTFCFSVDGEVALSEICLTIGRGKLMMLTGPIGSGKSALLLALLGEMVKIRGSMMKQPNLGIAYCSQEPWLPNLSILRIIQGPSEFDRAWYDRVIHACDLHEDLSRLPLKDETVIGSRGICLSGGQKQRISLARALYSRRQLLLLDSVTNGLDAATEYTVMERVLGENGICRQYGVTVILATHNIHFRHLMDSIIELTADGCLKGIQSPADMADVIKPSNTMSETDASTISNSHDRIPSTNTETPVHDISHKTGDIKLYLYYFKATRLSLTFATLVMAMCFTFSLRFPDIWLKWWSDSESQRPGEHQNLFVGVYVGLASAATLFFFLLFWIFLVESVPRTSIRLHKRLLDSVISAPFSFLASTDTGVILNRFSQDMSLIDTRLPAALLQTVDGLLDTVAEAILIGQSSPWAALIYPPMLAVLYILQSFYLRTSRQMRHLDLEAKSPLFTNFLETCEGIVTIRAFGWQHEFRKLNQDLLDESQKPYYLLYSIQCWLTLVLNLLVTVVLMVVMTLATQLDSTSSGALGVALINIAYASQTLPYLIQAWTALETSMGALARLRSFTSETPSEHLPIETRQPDNDNQKTWPSAGKIEFANLTAAYRADSEPVLHGINLNVPAGSKIGICGRTGSGKSSLILSLLRLNKIQHGTILIDDADARQIPRETIRRRLAVLPQDPLMLPGSIRSNLDPFGIGSDDSLTSVLTDVGMMEWVASRGGLDALFDKNMLSMGQQQLLCVARILLNPSKILVLDEATALVDLDTEKRITDLVRDRFQDCTVIAVAHRLHTIRHFDMIVVMDEGKVVETGHPDELLEDSSSLFREMWFKQDRGQ